ncbi:MAG: hypothetical protein KBB88_01265 [Candidatus Pacebacteria bacterium]|nr:hypothetical protein [Candidatus Paceibacterota bacterium]
MLLKKEIKDPDVDIVYAVNCKLEQYIISSLVIHIKEIMTNIDNEMSHGKVKLSRKMRNIVGDYKEKLYAIANEMSMFDLSYKYKVQSEEEQKSKGKDL